MSDYRIEIIDSFDAWKQLAGKWNDLLKGSRANTVFLTWEWLFSWAGCYLNEDRNLFILGVYRDHELIGIAPWYIRHDKYRLLGMRRIEFLGSPDAGSDYLDVIAKNGGKSTKSPLPCISFLWVRSFTLGQHAAY